jgi:predicted transcriptional regulator
MDTSPEAVKTVERAPQVAAEADLQTMIDLALSKGADQIAIVAEDKIVGGATREDVLKAVRGIDVH